MSAKDQHIGVEELSAFLDRDLDEARLTAIEAHLADCTECQQSMAEFGSIKSGLLQLGDVEPRFDLWPAIERATTGASESTEQPLRVWWRSFWLAPTAALVGVAAMLLLVFMWSGPGTQTGQELTGPMTALAAVQNAEAEYRKAITQLQGSLSQQAPAWNPETQKIVATSMTEIDASIKNCRTAIASDQNDSEAQLALLGAYQSKVDLLTDLVAESL